MNKYPINPKVELGEYRHYKGGEYLVEAIALDSENLKQVVVYRNMIHGTLWVRDEEEFLSTVEVDGQVVPRFEKRYASIVVTPLKRVDEESPSEAP